MALEKITEARIANRGILPLADIPGLESNEMKRRFDELVREVVVPVINKNADNTYDKREIQDLLSKFKLDSQVADMRSYVYDRQNRQADVYSYADKTADEKSKDAADKMRRKIEAFENREIHVAAGGNDQTGDGTKENPYRTTARALSEVPAIVSSDITIIVGRGMYEEYLEVSGRSGPGKLTIIGDSLLMRPSKGDPWIKGIKITGCSCQLKVSKFYIRRDCEPEQPDIEVVSSCGTFVEFCNCDSGTKDVDLYDLGIRFEASCGWTRGLVINTKRKAIAAINGAIVYCHGAIGQDNKCTFYLGGGIIATYGGRITSERIKESTGFELILP